MNSPEDHLDKLLRDWSDRQQPTAEQDDAFRNRLVRKIESCNSDDRPPNTKPARSWRARTLWFGLGAAVAASICWLILSLQSNAPMQNPAIDNETIASLQQAHLKRSAKVFGEMSRLFNGQLGWLAESNGTVELGIADRGDSTSKKDARPIVIQINVAARDEGQTRWETVWTADVITYEEQQVVLKEGNQKPTLNLWSHRLPDEGFAIDTCLLLPGAENPTMATAVIRPTGKPTQIFAGRIDQQEFRVFQSASHLAMK